MICCTSTSGRNGQAAVTLAGEAGGGGVVGVVLGILLVVIGAVGTVGTVVDGAGGGAAGAGSPLQTVTEKSVPTIKSPQVLFTLER